jgi:peptidoglycan-associated lipoprotein
MLFLFMEWMLMKTRFFLPFLFVLSVVACTDHDNDLQDPIDSAANSDGKADSDHSFQVADNGSINFESEILYFGFDDHVLTEEGMSRLTALGEYIKKNPNQKLIIQGHCDERGSTEYNLALGQKRSASVKAFLVTIGVKDDQLQTVSYGKEKPAMAGSNEEAWAKNRRATFTLAAL